MRISDVLCESMVMADVTCATKEEVVRVLAARLGEHPAVASTPEAIYESLMNRERLGSTGVGAGVAIPHAKLAGLAELVGCFARVPAGVAFDAIDKQPVNLIFALLVPENSAGMHLKALARISRLLKNEEFRANLLAHTDGAALHRTFVTEDER